MHATTITLEKQSVDTTATTSARVAKTLMGDDARNTIIFGPKFEWRPKKRSLLPLRSDFRHKFKWRSKNRSSPPLLSDFRGKKSCSFKRKGWMVIIYREMVCAKIFLRGDGVGFRVDSIPPQLEHWLHHINKNIYIQLDDNILIYLQIPSIFSEIQFLILVASAEAF